MSQSQKIWNKAIQRRVAVTSRALGSMKGIKMKGETESVSRQIQDLRTSELDLSKKYRVLFMWDILLGKICCQ